MASSNILDTIGNTPLVELTHLSPKPGVRLYAKLEGVNPTGSIKDRVARAIVEEAEARGELRPGMTLVEASTGNMALSLALVAKQKGYSLVVVAPPMVAPGVTEMLGLLGARVVPAPFEAGMRGPIEKALRLAEEPGCYATRQFQAQANVRVHYRTTGQEILDALPEVDVFVAGIGTGGTITGVGRRLKEDNPRRRIIGVTPQLGDQIQGIRSLEEGYTPPLLDEALLDSRFLVDSAQSFSAMRALLEHEGVFAGVSSGAVLHAAFRVARRMSKGNVVALLADTGWRYTPTLLGAEPLLSVHGDPDNRLWW